MVTQTQGQQQFDCADQLEAAVFQGRWKGLVNEKLWLVECDGGIMLEVELDKYLKKLSLLGVPDQTPDGKYMLRLVMRDGAVCKNPQPLLAAAEGFTLVTEPDSVVIAERLIENDQLYDVCRELLDRLFPKK